MNATEQRLYDFCAAQEVVNTHSHYLPDEQQAAGLDWLLDHAYVSWCGVDHRSNRAEYLRRLRGNSYFYWLEQGIRRLCSLDAPLTGDTWDAYEAALAARLPDADASLRVLREDCRYRAVVLDAFWNPGDDGGHPDLFTPTYRVNLFFFGWDERARDHNGNSPYAAYGWEQPATLEAYLDQMEAEIRRKVSGGCTALKCAAAYERGLDFAPPAWEAARRAYGAPNASPADIRAFQDAVFDRVCRAAAALSVPLQIHTGLGQGRRTNALRLLDAVEAHPETTFSLMHGGFPWTDDLLALTHNCPNVVLDLCWMPLLSDTRCERFLREWIEVGDMDRITWGCDTWHCVESCGAHLAIQRVLARVFAELVDQGRMDLAYAEDYIRHILFENARRLYGVPH